MGLDGVELIMAVEERFGIDIPDEDAEKLVTPGQLHTYVLGRLRAGAGRAPDEAKDGKVLDLRTTVETTLRRFLVDELGLDDEKIVAETSLRRLIPRKIRRSVWADWQKEAGFPLPELLRPGWVKVLTPAVWVFIAVALSLWWGSAFLGVLAATVELPLAMFLTLPMARHLPPKAATFGALVDYAVSHQDGLLLMRSGTDLWPIIQALIVEQLSVKPEDVTPTARFIEDLGAG